VRIDTAWQKLAHAAAMQDTAMFNRDQGTGRLGNRNWRAAGRMLNFGVNAGSRD
jgi:hypothetical protein